MLWTNVPHFFVKCWISYPANEFMNFETWRFKCIFCEKNSNWMQKTRIHILRIYTHDNIVYVVVYRDHLPPWIHHGSNMDPQGLMDMTIFYELSVEIAVNLPKSTILSYFVWNHLGDFLGPWWDTIKLFFGTSKFHDLAVVDHFGTKETDADAMDGINGTSCNLPPVTYTSCGNTFGTSFGI